MKKSSAEKVKTRGRVLIAFAKSIMNGRWLRLHLSVRRLPSSLNDISEANDIYSATNRPIVHALLCLLLCMYAVIYVHCGQIAKSCSQRSSSLKITDH